MAVNNVSVTTPGMKAACGNFETASSTATGQMQRVNSEMVTLQASWTGDASIKFGQAMNDWERQFDIIIRELNHMIEVMGGNANAYSANEETAVNTASAWAGGLSGM
jgi:WXG100 family type VII secretion target